jgi:hypothetical protein
MRRWHYLRLLKKLEFSAFREMSTEPINNSVTKSDCNNPHGYSEYACFINKSGKRGGRGVGDILYLTDGQTDRYD